MNNSTVTLQQQSENMDGNTSLQESIHAEVSVTETKEADAPLLEPNGSEELVEDEAKSAPEVATRTIELPPVMTVRKLANKLNVPVNQLIEKMLRSGNMVKVNSDIEFDAAAEIALEYNVLAVKEEDIVRPYTLRDLKDQDLWPLLQILKKIDIRECKESLLQIVSKEKTVREVGILTVMDMAAIFIGNLGRAHDEMYEFWSDLSGIPVKDIQEMEFGTLPMMIMDTFTSMKGVSFFKVLSRLL